MKARDIFGLFVRGVGVLLFLYSAWNLAWAFYSLATGEQGSLMYFINGLPGALVGVLMVGLGRYIVRASYPGNKDDSEP